MSLSRPLVDAIFIQNNIFMVMSICVRGPTLARLATVLVCRAGGKPSTWFPPGTRRADHLINNALSKFPAWGAPQI